MALVITDDTPAHEAADAIEARTRRLMAERAALRCTWQTRARRRELWDEIHDSLDEFNAIKQ